MNPLWTFDTSAPGGPVRLYFGPRELAPPGHLTRSAMGAREPGWNIGFPDRSVGAIRSDHYIETLSQADTLRWLIACRRALAPGGTLRIATLDLAVVAARYNEPVPLPDEERPTDGDWVDNRAEQLNHWMRGKGRQWLFDEPELSRLGDLAGLGPGRRIPGKDPRRLEMEFAKPERLVASADRPLVSILIPAYSPRFFEESLASARAQTYSNLEIIVGDDCATDAIAGITNVAAATDRRIRYQRNPERLGGRANLVHCFAEARGEFVKCLNDDDRLAPDCVRRMVDCFRIEPDLTLVTSRRERIDAAGAALPDTIANRPPVSEDSVVDGVSLGCALISSGVNFVGEPSTAMFRRRELVRVLPDFMSVDRRRIRGIMDVAIWLNLATRGDTVYLVDALSVFRIHPDQQQQRDSEQVLQWYRRSMEISARAWSRLGLLASVAQNALRVRPFGVPAKPWEERPAVVRDAA